MFLNFVFEVLGETERGLDTAKAIVLPENWTGGLDGESEETRTPSGEIYETTT
jgi:hypothetical protein